MSDKAFDVRRAYAVFGLHAGASAGHVRRRYKVLARQWHPDRHAADPRNQAEAASRMREINAAYHCLAGHLAGHAKGSSARGASVEGSTDVASSGRRLSREALDNLVESIGSDGPIDWLLEVVRRLGGALRWTFVALVAMASILRAALLVSRGGTAAALRDSSLFWVMALLALLLARELTGRKKLVHP